MFANFATRCHLNGPLRAVSPVAVDNNIDWKRASAKAKNKNNKKQAQNMAQAMSETIRDEKTQWLQAYFKDTFSGYAKKQSNGLKSRMQLLWVETVSLCIPIIYVASVLSLFFFVVALFAVPVIEHGMSGDLLRATLWMCPFILSFGLFFVLIKPLFGGFVSYHGRVLRPDEAPALMSLVYHLSKHLKVKPPKRIEINNETVMRVDAYAGINSIYRDDYKLIIGLPLLFSMDVPQLTAMLTHELSHFRSKQKKVAYYMINHVSEWLYHRASGEDKRHQSLLRRMQKEKLPRYEYIELWVWQRVHRFQQSTFHFLFRLHRKLTAWKCREIELETDHSAMEVVGSTAFASMLSHLRLIQSAQTVVSKQNDWAWKEGFLLDDYAQAIVMESQKITRKKLSKVQQESVKSITYFCPSDAIRLQQAKRIKKVGLVDIEDSASHLLYQGRSLSKELTALDYLSSGIKAPQRYSISSEIIRKLQQRKDKVNLLANHYFDGRACDRILRFEPSEEVAINGLDVQGSIEYIHRIRAEDRKQQIAARNLLKRIRRSFVLERLIESKLPVTAHMKGELPSNKNAKAYLKYMRAQYQQTLYQLESVDRVFYQRAHEALIHMGMNVRVNISTSFHNLELYCQVRSEIENLTEASQSLGFIVNGLHNRVSTKILQAGVNEKQLLWLRLMQLRKALKSRPIQVNLHRNNIHVLAYLDFKLGPLPSNSNEMTVEDMSDYGHKMLALLEFQYQKWQSQVAVALTRFEKEHQVYF